MEVSSRETAKQYQRPYVRLTLKDPEGFVITLIASRFIARDQTVILQTFGPVPEHRRRQGLGRKAMRTAASEARAMGGRKLRVSPVDDAAAAFYKAVGFAPVYESDPYADLVLALD